MPIAYCLLHIACHRCEIRPVTAHGQLTHGQLHRSTGHWASLLGCIFLHLFPNIAIAITIEIAIEIAIAIALAIAKATATAIAKAADIAIAIATAIAIAIVIAIAMAIAIAKP